MKMSKFEMFLFAATIVFAVLSIGSIVWGELTFDSRMQSAYERGWNG